MAAVLITGFVLTPIATPPGVISLDHQTITPLTPSAGAAIAANLSVRVVNQDPVPHGFVFATSVVNVSVKNGTTTEYLEGAALRAWEQNSTWVYHLPDGATVSLTGGSVSLPTADYVTINGTGAPNTATIVVTFSNSGPAVQATIDWSTNEFCAPSSGGSASTSFTPAWP